MESKNKFPEYIMQKLRQRRGLLSDDTSDDDRINEMSANSAFDNVCTWEGLIGYGPVIRSWIEGIYGVDLEEQEGRNAAEQRQNERI